MAEKTADTTKLAEAKAAARQLPADTSPADRRAARKRVKRIGRRIRKLKARAANALPKQKKKR